MPGLTLTNAEMARLLSRMIVTHHKEFKKWLAELAEEKLRDMDDKQKQDALSDTLQRMTLELSRGDLM